MPDAILHIGFNKCGSTALQQWLSAQEDALLAQGIWYRRMDPRTDVVCTNPHLQVLAFTLADQPVPSRPMNAVLGIPEGDRVAQDAVAHAFREQFEAQVANGGFKTWVGSSEALVSRFMTPEAISALADWLSGLFGNVRYVAYVRRPETWLVSLFGHQLRKTASPEDLTAFVDRFGPAPFARLLDMWRTAVGQEALDVRLFEESWLGGGGLVRDFQTVLDLPAGTLPTRSKRVNTTFRNRMNPWSRAPKRPVLSAQTRDMIAQSNAEGMGWIESTFFADRQTEFRSWAAGSETRC
ncbi:hypothetical protein [Antarctobacter heliothermus]|uniref:Sulfotransferase family protein n=1 Tax=Antarctobacter heliothermus TaxID=74033 RepID=A0A239HLH9_9RHOB|nr:hypothetical protein [Antarctobacter heliothermus]SNS81104.1 hypothetical protein SAMN04488078_103424 [Antarctobacter heliothermus]